MKTNDFYEEKKWQTQGHPLNGVRPMIYGGGYLEAYTSYCFKRSDIWFLGEAVTLASVIGSRQLVI